jgi:Holliday junction resolvase
MTNAKYIKGRALEYRIATFFKRKGYFIIRAAGSHGVADLVAVKKNKKPLFIQVKAGTGTVDKDEHNALLGAALDAGAIPVIAYHPDRKPIEYRVLTGIAMKTGNEERIVKGSMF